jgi:hypothetical protein
VSITRAFSTIFEDREWVSKLAIAALMTLCIPLGLLTLVLLLGYVVELARGVRANAPAPLPRWDNLNALLSDGTGVLLATIVYNIPNLLMSCCIFAFSGAFGQTLLGSSVSLALLCCAVPVLVIFNLVMWPTLAIGVIRYSEGRRTAELYRFGQLLSTARARFGPAAQWVVFTLLVNLGLLALLFIPARAGWRFWRWPSRFTGTYWGQLAREIGETPKRPAAVAPGQPLIANRFISCKCPRGRKKPLSTLERDSRQPFC